MTLAERLLKTVPAADLGGPGPPDAVLCSQAASEALQAVAGQGFRIVSLTLDLGSQALGAGEVAIRAQPDKRSRSVVFASVEARQGPRLVFRAEGLHGAGKPVER